MPGEPTRARTWVLKIVMASMDEKRVAFTTATMDEAADVWNATVCEPSQERAPYLVVPLERTPDGALRIPEAIIEEAAKRVAVDLAEQPWDRLTLTQRSMYRNRTARALSALLPAPAQPEETTP